MSSGGEDRVQSPKPTQRYPLRAIHRRPMFGDSSQQCRTAKSIRPVLEGQRVPRMVSYRQPSPARFVRREQMRPSRPQRAKLSPLLILQKPIWKLQPRRVPLAEHLFPSQSARSRRTQAALPPSVLHLWFACLNRADLSQRPKKSEEHTSELQSRPHLVCRLLLEKKKKN